MHTCSKLFDNLPFAHRQHTHDGHCAWIHGHNWAFEITFTSVGLDKNGFVIDFGKLKFVRDWLNSQFDHTLVLNAEDPHLDYLKGSLGGPPEPLTLGAFAKIVVVPNCGAEALAQYVCENVNDLLKSHGHPHVHVHKVVCFEDSRNSATYVG